MLKSKDDSSPMRFFEDIDPDWYEPPAANERLWRYMSLARFASMAVPRYDTEGRRYSTLFLSRADRLGDPFEGSIPRPEKELRANDQWSRGFPEGYHDAFRKWTFISCWHRNRGESAALWRLYADGEGSVAITSNYGRIRQALDHIDDGVAISGVAYVDYEKELFRVGDRRAGSQPFLHKRKSFEHEREVRVVTIEAPPTLRTDGRVEPQDFMQEQSRGGKVFLVDLAVLVEAVYVSPDAPAWVGATVEAMLSSWGWTSIPIRQSNSEAPLF